MYASMLDISDLSQAFFAPPAYRSYVPIMFDLLLLFPKRLGLLPSVAPVPLPNTLCRRLPPPSTLP